MIVPRPTTDAIYTQALSKGGALLPETRTQPPVADAPHDLAILLR